MIRTPAKTAESQEMATTSAPGTVTKHAGPPSHSVRKSVGDWESGRQDRPSISPQKTSSAEKLLRPKPSAISKLAVEAAGSPSKLTSAIFPGRVAEARSCMLSAKTHLRNSRNLKSEIRTGVLEAVDRLYQLVKEASSIKGRKEPEREEQELEEIVVETLSSSATPFTRVDLELLEKHMLLIKENNDKMEKLQATLRENTRTTGTQNIDSLVEEVRELRQCTEETGRKVSSLPSYAEVLSRPSSAYAVSPTKLPKHSVIVSSEFEKDTSEEVLGKVRVALEAKENGFQLTRVQKVRNQRVVLSCATKEELKKVRETITAKNKNLCVEEAKNKDPLVIIKNLLTFNNDDDIVASLRTQNASLLGDLADDEFRAMVRYRRRARNPHENHVVLQVSPKLWQKLTLAKRVHIDLQFAAVQDQSPLVQCTRCLGYGHGRRLCKETVDLCSYCAGPHLRADCPTYLTGDTPTCRNCRLAKSHETAHNAFDRECPIRKKWDAIARSSVAYC